jgi:hypothetical protein
MITYYCLRFETPPTWRPRSPYLYPTGTGWPCYTPGTEFSFRRLLWLAGLRWWYSIRPPNGMVQTIESESYVTTEGQSANLSWNKASICGLRPDFYYCQPVEGLMHNKIKERRRSVVLYVTLLSFMSWSVLDHKIRFQYWPGSTGNRKHFTCLHCMLQA